jgi:hypothetical protein
VLSEAEIEALWSSPTNALCTFEKWWLKTTSDVDVVSSDAIHSLMLQGSRTASPKGSLMMDSQTSNFEKSESFTFKISGNMRGADLPLAYAISTYP